MGTGFDLYVPTVQLVDYVKSFNAFNIPQIDYTSSAYTIEDNVFVSLVSKRDATIQDSFHAPSLSIQNRYHIMHD